MAARIQSLARGASGDPTVEAILDFSQAGFADTEMFGLLARRPELLKRVAAMFAYFLGGEGGLLEPELLELMRLSGAKLNACTYCATVRLQPVASQVKPKERALGLTDISAMTKAQAIAALKDRLDTSTLTAREAAAIRFVDRIIIYPHTVDEQLFTELRRHFSDDEIIELVCASSLFTWAGTLNTTVHVATAQESIYGGQHAYATA